MRRDLSKINLMMLTTLEALYLYKTTTKAAENTGLAQPSISWYLKQLRELTGDELFIRTAQGFEPTDFCTAYYNQAKEILNTIEILATSKNKTFDPDKQVTLFSVAIPYFKARMLLESLSVKMMREHPSIQSNLYYLKETEALQHLESGLLDIYIGLVSERLQKHFVTEKILESEFIVLCSDKSPFFKRGKINKQEFIDTPHIKLSPGFEPSMIDRKLKQHGLLQKTLLTVPDIGSEIILLGETDYLLIIDRNDAEIIMQGNNFKILKTAFALPQFPLYAVWHRRKKSDPAHKWLRDRLKADCVQYNSGIRPDPSRFKA